MSSKEDTASVQESETSWNFQVLRGRTGSIVYVLSDRTAVLRDSVYGDIAFTEDELKHPLEKEGFCFRSYFPVGREVHFDIEVHIAHVKCVSVWVSKKEKPNISCCQVTKKWKRKRTRKRNKKIPILKGKLSFVGSETAHLESEEWSGTVSFHRANAFLFGVPMERMRLDQIFRTGEELSFLLSVDDANKASCAWFGSLDVNSQTFEERMNCVLQYCMKRGICDSDMTIIVQELGKQRSPKLEENFGSCAVEVGTALPAGSNVPRELNGSCENETDTNQADRYDATGQITLFTGTASSNTVVTSSLHSINNSAIKIKEHGSNAITEQYAIATEGTSGIMATSESNVSSVTIVPEQSNSTPVSLVTRKQCVISTSEKVDFANQTSSTTDTNSANENHQKEAPTCDDFMNSAIQSNISSEVTELTEISLDTNSKIKESSNDKCDSPSESSNQSTRATGRELNSMAGCVTGHVNTIDKNEDRGHTNLHKVGSLACICDTESLCSPNCDTELNLYMSIVNKHVGHNLEASLTSVLKKQFGESVSHILAPYVMGCLKRGFDSMMQELMIKVLSFLIDGETEQKNLNSDLQFGDSARLLITSMVQEWKEEMMLITSDWKEKEKKEVESVLERTQTLRQHIYALYCSNMTSRQCNTCGCSCGDKNVTCSNDDVTCIADDSNKETVEKSTLVKITQDFMKLQDISDCQMMGMPKNTTEQGSQTVSTGCVLYLNCLPDL